MLLDANLLLYAVDEDAAMHEAATAWLESVMAGPVRIALPWQTIGAFMRIATNPRAYQDPLSSTDAWAVVNDWLEVPVVWIPPAGPQTAVIFGQLLGASPISANQVPDAQLAALAIEHGLAVYSRDADFARWPACRWTDPLKY